MAHTQGGWAARAYPMLSNEAIKAELCRLVDGTCNPQPILHMVVCGDLCVAVTGHGPDSQDNAHLVAAAPDLLAALREAAELIGVVARSTSNRRESTRWADMHRRALQAIAKATGQDCDINPREVA